MIGHPVGGISEAEVRAKVDAVWPDLKSKLAGWTPATITRAEQVPAYPLPVIKMRGDEDSISQTFSKRKWSMSLPIILPTKERVEEMLKGTARKPDEVLGKVGPRDGILTVELVAVHAVMAGCLPEYMPALIAACEALLEPAANWRGANTSTGSQGIMAVFNGPIVKEIGIATGTGAAGPGYHFNNTVAYALSQISYAVGGAAPGVNMANLSSPQAIVGWVVGEDEDGLPKGWEPFHVSRGFKKDDSVVTVVSVYPGIDHMDHNATGFEEYIADLATVNGSGGVFRAFIGEPPMIIFSPELLDYATQKGLSRAAFQKYLWENSGLPYKYVKGLNKGQAENWAKERGIKLTPETIIPKAKKPEDIHIVVSGGKGKHAHMFTPWGGYISRKIGK